MRFQLTLVRHGETEWNKIHRVLTFTDDPLNETGKEQAALLGQHLKGERFTKVYVSDLIRTHETAQGILGPTFPNSLFIKDVRLTEKSWGVDLEGTSGKDFLSKALASGDPLKYTPPGGETYEAIRERAASFFHDLCKEFTENPSFVEENVLVVSHGGWIAHLLDYFDTATNFAFVNGDDEVVTKKVYIRPLANSCVTKLQVVQISNSEWKVKMLTFNDTTHLNPATNPTK